MSNELEVKKENLPVDAGMMNDLLNDSIHNTGFETVGKDDVAIPFVNILQALSPQLRGETKIKGAEEGDLYNNVTGQFCKGPLKLIPCAYQKAWVEWVPRDMGGGLVAQHESEEILKLTKKNEKNNDVMPNGNFIVTTAYHFCMLVKEDLSFERVVLSLTSTQLKKSRRWNSQMMSLMIDVNGKKIRPPMYSHIYDASSVMETKDKNSWYGWDFSNPKMISNPDIYRAAKQFHDEVTKGLVKAQEVAQETVSETLPTDINNVL